MTAPSGTDTLPTHTVSLPLSVPVNLRDLAGIPIVGGTVREGFALRADDLAIVTEEYADHLVGSGVRSVIDLRSPAELAITGRGVLGARPDVNYHHVPLLADLGHATRRAPGSATIDAADDWRTDQRRFAPMYLRMYEQASAQIVVALAIIGYAPGAVAFHCAAGQDRTGVLAAALLLTLGADQADVVTDYARTGDNTAAIMERLFPVLRPLGDVLGFDLDETARAALRTEFSDAPMRELFAALADRHGDVLGPLRAAGLTTALVEQLRERALTPTATAQ